MPTKTVNSSAVTYLPAGEFVKRADLRTVGDLVSDNGVRVAAGALPSDPNLAAALLDASGVFESHLLAGGRYQPVDVQNLVGLTTVPPTVPPAAVPNAGQGLVYRLLHDLTMHYLWERRPDLGPVPEKFKWTMEFLDRLAKGERILPFLETQAAGVLHADLETPAVVEDRYLTTLQAEGLFGRRNNRAGGFSGPGCGGPWGW